MGFENVLVRKKKKKNGYMVVGIEIFFDFSLVLFLVCLLVVVEIG